jgi:hypothetical protein
LRRSTLVVAQRGRQFAEVVGELALADDYRLTIYERLVWGDDALIVIEDYGYEAWHGNEKLYWYDSQPHPNDPTLASTHPHHKHISPDIKHHRVPAPGLSFAQPNLPFLIEELEQERMSTARP